MNRSDNRTDYNPIPLSDELMNGQSLGAVSGMKFGLGTIGKCGCEVIAVYNMLLLSGMPQPYFVSEFGGIYWNLDEDHSAAWGYGEAPKTIEEFYERFESLTEVLLGHPKIVFPSVIRIGDNLHSRPIGVNSVNGALGKTLKRVFILCHRGHRQAQSPQQNRNRYPSSPSHLHTTILPFQSSRQPRTAGHRTPRQSTSQWAAGVHDRASHLSSFRTQRHNDRYPSGAGSDRRSHSRTSLHV